MILNNPTQQPGQPPSPPPRPPMPVQNAAGPVGTIPPPTATGPRGPYKLGAVGAAGNPRLKQQLRLRTVGGNRYAVGSKSMRPVTPTYSTRRGFDVFGGLPGEQSKHESGQGWTGAAARMMPVDQRQFFRPDERGQFDPRTGRHWDHVTNDFLRQAKQKGEAWANRGDAADIARKYVTRGDQDYDAFQQMLKRGSAEQEASFVPTDLVAGDNEPGQAYTGSILTGDVAHDDAAGRLAKARGEWEPTPEGMRPEITQDSSERAPGVPPDKLQALLGAGGVGVQSGGSDPMASAPPAGWRPGMAGTDASGNYNPAVVGTRSDYGSPGGSTMEERAAGTNGGEVAGPAGADIPLGGGVTQVPFDPMTLGLPPEQTDRLQRALQPPGTGGTVADGEPIPIPGQNPPGFNPNQPYGPNVPPGEVPPWARSDSQPYGTGGGNLQSVEGSGAPAGAPVDDFQEFLSKFGPEPDTAPIMPGPTGGGDLDSRLQAEALRQLENPSVFDDALFQKNIEAARGAADEDWRRNMDALDASTASRGTFFSSIAGQRAGELAGNRQREMERNVLLPLLNRRADTLADARRTAFANASGLSDTRWNRDARVRDEARGERAYRDAFRDRERSWNEGLRDKARAQALEEYGLGRDERRYEDDRLQQMIDRALRYGQPALGMSGLTSAGSGYGSAAGEYGAEAGGIDDSMGQLMAYLSQLYGQNPYEEAA